ncbi:MAG TPA: polymer-forming cytoskeletal protein, partial [Anaerolineales bacterium]|nr:polymer-forming cytoskeletal protein [Anaerolineales bacterium]
LAVLLISAVPPAHAFDGRGGEVVTIGAGEIVNDDLYVGATTFVLDGTVNGDVIAAGESMTINGTVNGNLITAGQTVVVNGRISGDVLAAGSALQFGRAAYVGGDVVGAGYSLELQNGAMIGRDAVLAAGQILLAADVGRNVKAGASALELAGNVGGNVQAAVGEASAVRRAPPPTMFMAQVKIAVPVVPQGLSIDQSARILGNLEYTQNSDLSFPAGVVAGKITRLEQPEGSDHATRVPSTAERAGKWALESLRSLVTLLLIGMLLLWLVPNVMRGLASQLAGQPWPSLGWGVVAYAGFLFLLLVVVFVMILGAVLFGVLTLGGLSAAIIWTGLMLLFALIVAFVLATAFAAKIVFGMTLGQWLLRKTESPLAEHRYWPMLIGVAITVVVIAALTFPLIPGFLGGLLNFVIILFGLGTMWVWLRQQMQRRKAAPAQS